MGCTFWMLEHAANRFLSIKTGKVSGHGRSFETGLKQRNRAESDTGETDAGYTLLAITTVDEYASEATAVREELRFRMDVIGPRDS